MKFNKLGKTKQRLVKSMIKTGFKEEGVIKFAKTVHYKNIVV